MARNRPVAICEIKHSPRSEPKFHNEERLAGAGRSISAEFAALNRGWFFRIGVITRSCS